MERKLVGCLRPEWNVIDVTEFSDSTESVSKIEYTVGGNVNCAVLKVSTSDVFDDEVTVAEPVILEKIREDTDIPVPRVIDSCFEHESFPTPFYLLEYKSGVVYTEETPSYEVLKVVIKEAGEFLAELHSMDSFSEFGVVGYEGGELCVLDTEGNPSFEDNKNRFLDEYMNKINSLDSGGNFPHLADEPQRFGDLISDMKSYFRSEVEGLPDVSTGSRFCHWDYQFRNLVFDREAQRTAAVLDWGCILAEDPAYNIAKVEANFLENSWVTDKQAKNLRNIFRETYAYYRSDWEFTESIERRLRFYKFTTRIDAMASFPLWFQEYDSQQKRDIEEYYREYVNSRIN